MTDNFGVILLDLIKKQSGITDFKNKNILEIGSRYGELSCIFRTLGSKVTEVDLINGIDFETHDFKEEKFDLIVSVFTFHHFNLEKSILKAAKMLSNNGKLIIIDLYGFGEKTLLRYVLNQITVYSLFNIKNIISLSREIGPKNTFCFIYQRIAYLLDSKNKEHLYDDFNKNLPPKKEVWLSSLRKTLSKFYYRDLLGSIFILVVKID